MFAAQFSNEMLCKVLMNFLEHLQSTSLKRLDFLLIVDCKNNLTTKQKKALYLAIGGTCYHSTVQKLNTQHLPAKMKFQKLPLKPGNILPVPLAKG